jgi:hypothetical protein
MIFFRYEPNYDFLGRCFRSPNINIMQISTVGAALMQSKETKGWTDMKLTIALRYL